MTCSNIPRVEIRAKTLIEAKCLGKDLVKPKKLRLKPRVVNSVYAHLHLDELFAYMVARLFGRLVFKGIETAKVSTDAKSVPAHRTIAAWIKAEALALGGFGDVTDEHTSGESARLKGASATSLMMDILGVEDPHLHALAVEVTYLDNNRAENPNHAKGHLASVMKMGKVHKLVSGALVPWSDDTVWRWSFKMLEAVYADLANPSDAQPKYSFKECYESVIKAHKRKKSFKNEDALAGLMRVLEGAESSPYLLGIKRIYEALWRSDLSPTAAEKKKEVFGIMESLILVLWQDQIIFHAFLAEADAELAKFDEDPSSQSMWFWLSVRDSEGRLRTFLAAIAQTDNPLAHNVLRYRGAILSIVRNRDGNVSVQGNQKIVQEQWVGDAFESSLADFCAMCRHSDMSPEAAAESSWEQLRGYGDCLNDGKWHLNEAAWLTFYNGTHNVAAVPTCLSLEHMKAWAQAAFSPVSLEEWLLQYLPLKPLAPCERPRRKRRNDGHTTSLDLNGRGVKKGVAELFEAPESRN